MWWEWDFFENSVAILNCAERIARREYRLKPLIAAEA